MFRSSILVQPRSKTWQRVAFAATAAATLASAFIITAVPARQQQQHKQHYQHHYHQQQHFTPYRMASSRTRIQIFPIHRVKCQEEEEEHAVCWNNKLDEHDSFYYEKMPLPDRNKKISHVISGQLLRDGCIEKYDIYQRMNNNNQTLEGMIIGGGDSLSSSSSLELIVCDIRLGENLDGHGGVVHGGVVAMLFDDAMGFGFEAMGIPMAVTANLNVDYRLPVPANSHLILRVRLIKQEGRKLYFSAEMTSLDGSVLYCESTSLYIIPRQIDEMMEYEKGGSS